MKKTFLMAVAIVAAVTMTSCKSHKVLSEAAEVAEPVTQVQEVASPITYTTPKRATPNQSTPTSVSKAQPSQPVQAAPVQQQAAPVQTPAPKAQPGDRQEKVKLVNDTDNGLLRDYNVVVGSFGSKENAENMKRKMAGRGYNAFLIQNESGMYRVVAGGYDSREDALSVRDDIRTTYSTEQGTCAEAWLLIPTR